MTTEEKNIAIAEMLGCKVEVWKEIGQPYYKGTIYNPIIKQDWCCGMAEESRVWETLARVAKYNSDANWQFAAIDWIEKEGYEVSQWFDECDIGKNIDAEHYEGILAAKGKNRLEATFEALYQFSQYLKEKK